MPSWEGVRTGGGGEGQVSSGARKGMDGRRNRGKEERMKGRMD